MINLRSLSALLLSSPFLIMLAACSDSRTSPQSHCGSDVKCGHFTITNTKESTPIFFATATPSPIYRLCVTKGSVILQTIEADGNAKSLGGEIRAGNCADISFEEKTYIIGNTAERTSDGIYYAVD